jgi:GT2 family glycosyltransferase
MVSDKTFIVVPNFNGGTCIKGCLASIEKNAPLNQVEVVVVDDGSIDDSLQIIKSNFPWAKLISNSQNFGFSKSTNAGIRYSLEKGAQYILLLNNDVEMTEDETISKMISIFESDKEIGVLGCKLLYPNGSINHAGGYVNVRRVGHYGFDELDNGQYDLIRVVDYVVGAALMIKSKVIREIGMLDEGFSPLYFEETDWCMRTRIRGYKVVYTPHPSMIHRCGFSTKKIDRTIIDFYIKKNWIRFWLLNFSLKDILKRILFYEPREILISYIIEPDPTKSFGQKIRSNVESNLVIVIRAWVVNLQNLSKIVAKRIERFSR